MKTYLRIFSEIFILSLVFCISNGTNSPESDKYLNDAGSENLKRINYDGAQLWRVSLENQDINKKLEELQDNSGVSIWNTDDATLDLFLTNNYINETRELFENADVPFSILIENIQTHIDAENPQEEEDEEYYNRKGHRMSWDSYHAASDIIGFLDFVQKTYPDICTVETIGHSVEGRRLKLLKISNGNPFNLAIWVDGGIHAREWISTATVTYLINYLIENWDDQPDYIRNIDWYILPLANPDGYEHTRSYDRLWRKNRGGSRIGGCVGTDLNRNFGFKWGLKGTSKLPCNEIFAGSGPFSEPESLAQKTFMEKSNAQFKAFLTVHCYGQYILYPWGYDRLDTTDVRELDAVARTAAKNILRKYGTIYSVGGSGKLLYPASGASDDWAKGDLGIKYTYTVELPDKGTYGFILPASKIKQTSLELLEFVKTVAQVVHKQ